MDKRISVIIPTHNRSTMLQRALRSVIAQDHPPQEIIVVDDGSTDDTAEILRRTFPGVIYLSQSLRGVSSARNRGINSARYPWLALLDSDDEWMPEKLSRQLSALTAAHEVDQPHWLCHTDEIWIRRGRRVNPKKRHQKSGGWIFKRCLPLCVISPSSTLIHRRIFDEVGLFDESLPACEDYDMWLRTCSRYPVLYINSPLINKYGGHHDQLSQRYWGMDRFRVKAIEKVLLEDRLLEVDRAAARKVLRTKLGVLINGARKRKNQDLLRELTAMHDRWF